MKLKSIAGLFALLGIVGWGPFTFISNIADSNAAPGTSGWINSEVTTIHAKAPNLSEKVLKLSLTAYVKARQQGYDNKQLLTIVDYSKPSTEPRLWVVDVKNNKVLMNTLVAHGKNSGGDNTDSFSNQNRSLKSSLGVFVTEDIYDGHHGASLRVAGLEPGFNDHALDRDIVFHGADYVSSSTVKQLGRLGRSWGCFAVAQNVVSPLINTIKNKTVVVAYYPDQKWLQTSTYVNAKVA